MAEQRLAQKWEQDERYAQAWQEVWEWVRATRHVWTWEQAQEDATMVAFQFAENVLGEEEADEGTDAYFELAGECEEQMRLLF